MAVIRPRGDGAWDQQAQAWSDHLARKRVGRTLERYMQGDDNLRLGLWLEHRDLRGAFDVLEENFVSRQKKPRGALGWLRRYWSPRRWRQAAIQTGRKVA